MCKTIAWSGRFWVLTQIWETPRWHSTPKNKQCSYTCIMITITWLKTRQVFSMPHVCQFCCNTYGLLYHHCKQQCRNHPGESLKCADCKHTWQIYYSNTVFEQHKLQEARHHVILCSAFQNVRHVKKPTVHGWGPKNHMRAPVCAFTQWWPKIGDKWSRCLKRGTGLWPLMNCGIFPRRQTHCSGIMSKHFYNVSKRLLGHIKTPDGTESRLNCWLLWKRAN